jgi:tellurium resistance protein TerZ
MSINLEKGQKIDLKKPDGSALTRVKMGLGWDVASNGGSIDLDASCAMYTEHKELVDTVSFRHLRSDDGSIVHSGDNLTGAGDGDDEVINVDLGSIPVNVKTIVFVVNSFRGQRFTEIQNCFSRLVDTVNNKEICIYKLREQGNHTGLIMCKLYRHNGDWKMAALGIPCNGSTIQNISEEIVRCL